MIVYLDTENRRVGEEEECVWTGNGAEVADLVVGDFGAVDRMADRMDDKDDLWMSLLQEEAIT